MYTDAMDIVSHGLWGGVGFGRTNRRVLVLAVFFGMLPDLLSFGVFTVMTVLGVSQRPDWSGGPPSMDAIPPYVHVLYNISHSLVIVAAVSVLVWLFARRYLLPWMAYGFAVALDIPTHSSAFFPTPFLWPLSDYTVNGIPWSNPIVFIPNVLLLCVAYGAWWHVSRRRR